MKLKVGDIELDSQSGISFDGRPSLNDVQAAPVGSVVRSTTVSTGAVPPAPTYGPLATPSHRSLDALLPDWKPARFMFVSVGLAVSTATAALAIIPAYFRGTPLGLLAFSLVPCGLLSVASAFAAAHVHRRGPRLPVDDPAILAHARSISVLLHGTESSMRIEDIAERLALPDAAVAGGLVLLVRDGGVIEDVDIETNTWSYRANREAEDLKSPDQIVGRRALDVLTEKKPSGS